MESSNKDKKNAAMVAFGRYSESGEDLLAPRMRDLLQAKLEGASNEQAGVQAHGMGLDGAVHHYMEMVKREIEQRARQKEQENLQDMAAMSVGEYDDKDVRSPGRNATPRKNAGREFSRVLATTITPAEEEG
ncbi:hypothetical protein LTR36_005291 [Oleoguttula mirabilis]|uniref:Uncharacterized protein n=1 Tax=Oleoguttula mirabilis TaxID=1507867 RepID=A0AAV9JEV7_9PEZI|nr:hypothetical protein LTR36_005291 [Oleoguttula mirabilis]